MVARRFKPLAVLLLVSACTFLADVKGEMLVLVGGFQSNSSSLVLSLDAATGQLSPASSTAAAGTAPAFFAWQPTAPGLPPDFLFVANHGKGAPGTGVSAVRWLADGSIEPVEPMPGDSSPSGFAAVPDPAHVAVSPDGNWVLTAAYDNGTVTVTPVEYGPQPGQLSLGDFDVLDVCTAPHEVKFDPSNRFVYIPCLGASAVAMFTWDGTNGTLAPLIFDGEDSNFAMLPQGSGPRHMVFHPTLEGVAYTLNELGNSVARLDWDAETGVLSGNFSAESERIVSTLPPGTPPGCPIRQGHTGCAVQAAAEIAISADGRFLYASNRGEQGGINNVAIFAVSTDDGSLDPLAWEDGDGAVQFPRMISLTPDDAYLLVGNQHDDSVTVFRRDATTGLLNMTDTFSTEAIVLSPAYVHMVPSALHNAPTPEPGPSPNAAPPGPSVESPSNAAAALGVGAVTQLLLALLVVHQLAMRFP